MLGMLGSVAKSSMGRFVLGVGGAALSGFVITETVWRVLERRRACVDSAFKKAMDAFVPGQVSPLATTGIDWVSLIRGASHIQFIDQRISDPGNNELAKKECGKYLSHKFDDVRKYAERWIWEARCVGVGVGIAAGALIPGGKFLKGVVIVAGSVFGFVGAIQPSSSRFQAAQRRDAL